MSLEARQCLGYKRASSSRMQAYWYARHGDSSSCSFEEDRVEDGSSQSFQFQESLAQGRAGATLRPWRPRQRITLQRSNGVNCLTLRYQGEARSTRLAREQFHCPHSLSSAVLPCLSYACLFSLLSSFLSGQLVAAIDINTPFKPMTESSA